MKKIFALVLIALMVCGVAFAADSQTQSVCIQGKVPEGFINPGIDEEKPSIGEDEVPVAGDDAIKIYARVITSSDTSPSIDSLLWKNAKYKLSDFESFKTVDLVHNTNIDSDIDSLGIVYAVLGNLSSESDSNLKVTISTDGWERNDQVEDTLYLELNTVAQSSYLLDGGKLLTVSDDNHEGKHESTISVVKSGEGAGVISPEQQIGYTTIVWGATTTPPAGDYQATITIGVIPEN